MNQITKITLAWELYGEGIPKSHIAQRLSVHRETIGEWVSTIKENSFGLTGFLDNYLSAKKGERAKRKLDGLLIERICRLREENSDCCGQKIKKYLKDEYGIILSAPTIYKVLRERYILRSKWKKNQARGPVPKAGFPREVVQMNSIDFGNIFAFTGIDIFVKDVAVKLYPALTNLEGSDFLDYSMEEKFKHTNLLQVDGGPEFKDLFRKKVLMYTNRFRVARLYRKNEQSYIESLNRSLRKECLGWGKYSPKDIPVLEQEIKEYLNYYHQKRPHLSLNLKTPNDILEEYRIPVSDI